MLDGKQLRDQTVSGPKIKDGAVTTDKIDVNADLSVNNHRLTNVTDPSVAQDAATKAYVDAAVSGRPTTANKNMVADVTVGDGNEATAVAIAATPIRDGYVQVFVNGLRESVGDGVKTKSSYFSADAGATARTIVNITAGDKLYWNGSVAGYQLAAADLIDFDYVS